MKLLINDTQSLTGATSRFGNPIPIYDDGYGLLYISRDSMGINGIVRAQSWEDAYSICEDEFFPEASETIEDIQREYGFKRTTEKIVKDASGEERVARFPEDYPHEAKGVTFVRWQTTETPDPDAWADNELFQEAFGFRPNGPNATDTLKHGIYAKDLNGDYMDVLTPELLAELEITLSIENSD